MVTAWLDGQSVYIYIYIWENEGIWDTEEALEGYLGLFVYKFCLD